MAKQGSNLHGILVIDKPGWDEVSPGRTQADIRLPTSHDLVQRVRRWSGQRRIGHTGTLDPMASGVLVLCLGLATRLVEYYQGHDKSYDAEIVLGTSTDTYDATGMVVAQGDLPPLTPTIVETALDRFRGTIQQQPPIYSALKQDGETAYRKARRGESVELATRTVTFHALELVEIIAPDRLVLRVRCSAGTYIRSLAYDLGMALGVPAHLGRLRRTAAGAFTSAQAHTPDIIEAAASAQSLGDLLLPLGTALDLPACIVDDEQARRFGFGQHVELTMPNVGEPGIDAPKIEGPVLMQACNPTGRLLGIIRRVAGDSVHAAVWKAEKWLVVDGETV
ncbi:MAG: tRNA pseudouridine(55) synthase TruB [Litorilinea sp.]